MKRAGFLGLGLMSIALNAFGQQGVTRPAIVPAAPVPAVQKSAPAGGVSAINLGVRADYVLGTDDAIQVTVWKDATLTGPLLVRPDGMISMALLGDVKAAGLTPMALSQSIAEKLKKYITDPLVTVTVTGANSQRIYFIGEVLRPGPVPLTPEMTILQAVSTAGGLTPYADAKHIYILRGPAGKQQKIPFDYKKAVKLGVQPGVVLTAGDTIVVP